MGRGWRGRQQALGGGKTHGQRRLQGRGAAGMLPRPASVGWPPALRPAVCTLKQTNRVYTQLHKPSPPPLLVHHPPPNNVVARSPSHVELGVQRGPAAGGHRVSKQRVQHRAVGLPPASGGGESGGRQGEREEWRTRICVRRVRCGFSSIVGGGRPVGRAARAGQLEGLSQLTRVAATGGSHGQLQRHAAATCICVVTAGIPLEESSAAVVCLCVHALLWAREPESLMGGWGGASSLPDRRQTGHTAPFPMACMSGTTASPCCLQAPTHSPASASAPRAPPHTCATPQSASPQQRSSYL